MNLCKIGWHDWEAVGDRCLLFEKAREFLAHVGFTRSVEAPMGATWTREKTKLQEFGWTGDIDSCIPNSPKSKVCLRCGKTHKNYSEARVIAKVHELVLEKEAELARRKKAEELLGRSE